MKAKILTAVMLLVSSNLTFAQGGGLGIGNVQQHMNIDQWIQTITSYQQVIPQGPIDKYETDSQPERMVDTNQYKHSYDGQANNSVIKGDLLAGRPNFIRYLRRRV